IENPKLTRGQEDGGDSRHFFSSAIAVCSICSDATRVSSPAGVDSDQQVLIQPQVGVHIEQVPQPQQPPQPLQTAAEAPSKKCASAVWLKFISSYKPVF